VPYVTSNDPWNYRGVKVNILFVLHDPPYGTERVYNGLRWATELARQNVDVRVFLFGDSVISVMAGQKVPDGYYNVAKQLTALGQLGVAVGSCGTCLDARGITADMTLEVAHRSSMKELTEWTLAADKVINV
jgi:uncharacterized protein involved in oxidation of intracellular sulfur